jgi:prepilin-type N-terminal cleavage/methylation domain-containing protein
MSRAHGFTLTELMIAMAIGVAIIAAALTVFVQARAAYRVNESIARLQERARFALAVIEPDLELAGYLGFSNEASTMSLVSGGTVLADAEAMRQVAEPLAGLPAGAHVCGVNFALDVSMPVHGSNGSFALGRQPQAACRAYQSGVVAGADTLTIRRADPREALPEANRLQIFASRFSALTSQRMFFDGRAPGLLDANHRVHDFRVRSYYVARDSVGRRGYPALRVKSLTRSGPAMAFDEDEVMPGIEDLQVQFGIGEGAAERYVNPDAPELQGAAVVAVRVWLRVRADEADHAFIDTHAYRYGDVTYVPAGDERHFRRAVVQRTVAVRNARRS